LYFIFSLYSTSSFLIIKEILVSIEDNLNVKAGKYYLIT
jgi:hypothetical protein